MATYYIDPEGGNDANPGTSFADRKKTYTSLGTLAANDEVRVIASRPPVTAVDGTWTDNTNSVTLSSALNLTITDSTAAWTAAANVTCITNIARKVGATSAVFSILTAFTTGKAAHFQLPGTVDASSYDAVSFWFFAGNGSHTFGTNATLTLCSDTSGNTPVETIPIAFLAQNSNFTTAAATNQWFHIYWEKGSALSSTINSVALNYSVDPGVCSLLISNIVACHSRGNSNHLCHGSLVGKNTIGEPEWYSVMGISGTTVTLGSVGAAVTTPGRTYRGTSETVPFYVNPVDALGMISTQNTVAAGATTSTTPVTISGGWDRTAMSTQSGETWHGHCYPAGGIQLTPTRDYVLTNIGYANLQITNCLITSAITGSLDARLLGMSGCAGPASYPTAASKGISIDFGNVMACQTPIQGFGGATTNQTLKARRISGTNAFTSGSGDGIIASTAAGSCGRSLTGAMQISSLDNNTRYGILGADQDLQLIGCNNISNNGTAFYLSGAAGGLGMFNCAALPVAAVATAGGRITQTAVAGVLTDNRISDHGFTAVTQTTTRHTATGAAWQINPLSALAGPLAPFSISLAKIAVASGTLVTVKCWVRRDNTGLEIGIGIQENIVSGISQTAVYTSVAINTWDELTLTFTPTASGVVEIFGLAHGGTTFTGYFDDITVTQV